MSIDNRLIKKKKRKKSHPSQMIYMEICPEKDCKRFKITKVYFVLWSKYLKSVFIAILVKFVFK